MPKRDKAAYNEYMRDYMLSRYHSRRADAIAYLGGACAVCGSVEDLDFDHIDPSTKTAEIAKIMLRRLDRLYEELAKCQLLCRPHHVEKSRQDISTGKCVQRQKAVPAAHGTWKMYASEKCRCAECRAWKRSYRAKLVHADGTLRVGGAADTTRHL